MQLIRLLVTLLFVIALGSCEQDRLPLKISVQIEEGEIPRCIILSELQARADNPFGMNTYVPVHIQEIEESGVLSYSEPLCPNIQIEVAGGRLVLVRHEGGSLNVDLRGRDPAPMITDGSGNHIVVDLPESGPVSCDSSIVESSIRSLQKYAVEDRSLGRCG